MAKRKFCNDGCKESYNQDLRMGIIYPPMALLREEVKGIEFVPVVSCGNRKTQCMSFSWEDGCKMLNQCYYCRESLEKKG